MASAGQLESPLPHQLSVSSPASSSSSAAESNFRELDDVFLQTQTRIWLGEVLQIRLDEEMNISDLLADGELLFEASRLVWKMLLKNRTKLRHTISYKYEPFASRKSSGKYMPYSNVDSFLKICKILGLTGIDLFTPSDVVEKKNTRKVCMCIRSLTKKARSKHLNVPDFDIVTYTVAMPTNMVGWIRRRLERSQCSFSSSASDNSCTSSRSKSIQNNLVSASPRSYDSDSDEADSNPTILQSGSLPLNCSNDASCHLNSIIECLPGVANTQLQSESLCESVGSLYMEHDFEQNDMASPTCVDSVVSYCDRACTESGLNQNSENGIRDLNDLDLEYGVSDSIDAKTPVNSINRNSNGCCFQIYRDDSSLFDREDSNGFKSNSSHGSNATQRNLENGFRRFADDDLEVSSTANVHSLSEAMMNLDFYDQLDDFGTICSYNLQNPDTSQDPVNHETFMQNIVSSSVKPSIDMEVADDDRSTNLFIQCTDLQSHTNIYSDNVSFENGVSVSRINPMGIPDEAKLYQVDSKACLYAEECEELPLDQCTSQCQSDQSDVEGRCMVTMASTGNNGLELPSNPASLEEKLTEDAIQMVNHKSIVSDNDNDPFSATMSESVSNIEKLTHNHLQVGSFDDIIEVTYISPKNISVEESEKDVRLGSTDGGGGQDTRIQGQDTPNEGENGDPVDKKEHVRSESMDKDRTEQGNVNVKTQNLKSRRRPSLKSVVKGTALISMLFVAFHLRRNGRELIGAVAGRSGESTTTDTEASHVQKTNGVMVSLRKGQQKGGVYPAEKLNFW